MNYWTRAHNLATSSGLSRPYGRTELIEYLSKEITPATEGHAGGVIDQWLEQGYLEVVNQEGGEERYDFTDKALDYLFD